MEFVDPHEATHANVLLFGPPKTGKTAGAATAPGRVLYLNAELPNATRFALRRDTEDLIKVPRIPKYESGKTHVADLLREIMVGSVGEPDWDTVVIDPVGELYRLMVEEQSQRSRRPTLDQRGNATIDLERFCRFMCEAPVHFVIVAHEMQAEGEDNIVSLPFTGSKSGSQSGIGPKLAGMVDVIAYTAVAEIEGEDTPQYLAQLVAGKGRNAGSRFPELTEGESFRPVDLARWFELAGITQAVAA